FPQAVGADIDLLAVDLDVAVIDELAGGEDGRHELGAIDHGLQAALQEADHVLGGVAAVARGLLVHLAELALADIAVVALQALLRHQLQTEIGGLLAALAVLARAIFAVVDGALGAAPEIDAQTAVDLVLSGNAL